jgi:hypothetical protein
MWIFRHFEKTLQRSTASLAVAELRYGHEDAYFVGTARIGGVVVATSDGRDGKNRKKAVFGRGWDDVGKRLAVEDSTVLASLAHCVIDTI